ncbi:hypothetical protein ANO14919_046100 [Xylariales sp. No.14919]|nr:hypothetical protein ANO14919_046100 [Xylariales sp. No.14919]
MKMTSWHATGVDDFLFNSSAFLLPSPSTPAGRQRRTGQITNEGPEMKPYKTSSSVIQ